MDNFSNINIKENCYDGIVIGAGHAGVEAGLALARKGHKTLLITLSLDAIAFLACNPSIGGTAKGHLVREIDALGGEMGLNADRTALQLRMLNLGKGPAVHSLRGQADKVMYHHSMKQVLENEPLLDIIQGEASEILVDGDSVKGVKITLGITYYAPTVIVASGVYLDANIIIGEWRDKTGPSGFKRATELTKNLVDLGIPIRRFKTGTPARVDKNSLDFSKMEIQNGDEHVYPFSFMTDGYIENKCPCYLTYTNEKTHQIIIDNIARSPLYNGSIHSVGPRYCPSIEDKVMRFRDKSRHQLFIEPESMLTNEMYVQGMSSSMPFDVQDKMYHSVAGMENVKIMRYAYAIEYDCIDSLILTPALRAKHIKGLYFAGQVNGSSGYEEAGAQGLIAGLNAALYLEGRDPLILRRDEAYIGVLIDDLVTKGTNEPYRMMTARAEYRLNLRQENADIRLTQKGYELGLVKEDRYARFQEKLRKIADIEKILDTSISPKRYGGLFEAKGESIRDNGITFREMLRRNYMYVSDLQGYFEELQGLDTRCFEEVETRIKYEGYLNKQNASIKEAEKLENRLLPEDIDYSKLEGLRIEARQKLNKVRPLNLGQASRISGVSPADITVLMVYLFKSKGE